MEWPNHDHRCWRLLNHGASIQDRCCGSSHDRTVGEMVLSEEIAVRHVTRLGTDTIKKLQGAVSQTGLMCTIFIDPFALRHHAIILLVSPFASFS